MKIAICDDEAAAHDLAAGEILAALRRKPELVLGLATGSTPIGVYERLVRARREGKADFTLVRTFNLDEYLDLGSDHPQSYRAFMWKNLFDGLDIPSRNVHFPPAEGNFLEERCQEYEDRIRRAGGIDIQLLGIGSDGHIGFNEPTASLRYRTCIQTLTPKTMRDNSRFFSPGEFQPQMAVTMGIGTILDARRIILQAFGTGKAEAIRAAIEGPISSFCPASALQLHQDTLYILDPGAASLLTMREYYRRAQANEEALRKAGRL
jgi:glucosamine-6-phosphate deaminase